MENRVGAEVSSLLVSLECGELGVISRQDARHVFSAKHHP